MKHGGATQKGNGRSGSLIGVDFDNTVVRYDDVLRHEASRQGWLSSKEGFDKKDIRDAIRRLPDGELKWRTLQAAVYGPHMGRAQLAVGVERFFASCRRAKIPVRIISHKTEHPAAGDKRMRLRDTALEWMRNHRFFDSEGLGLSPGDVYFESTRADKCARIQSLGCTHMIDDLEETFLEDAFPMSVEKILYAPSGSPAAWLPGVYVFRTWMEIDHYFFHKAEIHG